MNYKELIVPIVYNKNKEEEHDVLNRFSEFYNSHFTKLLESLGHGVVITHGESNLSPNIHINTSETNNIIVNFSEGCFLDKKGRVIVVSSKINREFNINEYKNQMVFFYLRGRVEEGKLIQESDNLPAVKNNILKGYITFSKDKKKSNSEYIELCRINIGDDSQIINPKNPFNPQKNELDIRYVPRILSNNSLPQEIRLEIAKYLFDYASFFTKLAPKIQSFNASIIASNAYDASSKIKFNYFSTFEIYDLLDQIVKVSTFFYDEIRERIEEIHESDFRRSLTRLESIFNAEESITYNIPFYEINLSEEGEKENFWQNILSHIEDISSSKDEWKLIVKTQERVEIEKNYLLVGRVGGDNLDIELENDYISGNHLKITRNDINPALIDIEDLGSSNGTFFKGIRYEKHRKVTIHENESVELYDYEFDIYNNLIVKKFMENK